MQARAGLSWGSRTAPCPGWVSKATGGTGGGGGTPGRGGGGEGWGLGQVLDPSSDLTCTPTLPSAGARHKHHLAGVVGVLVSPGCRLDRGPTFSASRRPWVLKGNSPAGSPRTAQVPSQPSPAEGTSPQTMTFV